jgi:hypothetical protein
MGNSMKKLDNKFITYFNLLLQQKDSIIENQNKLIENLSNEIKSKDSLIETQNKTIQEQKNKIKPNIIYNDASIQTFDEQINIIPIQSAKNIKNKHLIDTYIDTTIDTAIDATIDDNTEEIICSIQTIETYDNSKKIKQSKYPNCGKKWTEKDKEKLKEMYINAIDKDEMVNYFGRSKYALICELRRIIYNDYIQTHNRDEICNQYNITEEKLDEIIKKHTNSKYYKN